jgi:hypothetical protein
MSQPPSGSPFARTEVRADGLAVVTVGGCWNLDDPLPSVVVRGTYDIRPKRFVNSARMKNPKLVFEVFDENEMAKSKRGEKSVNGAEIDITLWADARTYQLFRDMGYPDSAWHTNPDGTIDLPIHAVVNTDRPLLTCEIDWKEGNTPGQGFYSFKSVVRKKERTT